MDVITIRERKRITSLRRINGGKISYTNQGVSDSKENENMRV